MDADGNISTTERYYLVLDNSKTISKADYEQAEKDLASLDYLSKSEVKYADLGLGLQEDGKTGEVIGSSVFNVPCRASISWAMALTRMATPRISSPSSPEWARFF